MKNMKNLKKTIALTLLAAMMGSVVSVTEAASIPLFNKVKEKIGLGPSSSRIRQKLQPGKPRILANGQKYQIIDEKWGYTRAKAYAEKNMGHLAIIDSAYENKLLYEFMIAQGYEAAYFGLADTRFEGNWVCVDGKEPKYTNWHHGQPDRTDQLLRYAMLYKLYTNGSWKAGTFSNIAKVKGGTAFIIEWDAIYTPQQADEFNSGKPITIYPDGNPNVKNPQQPTTSSGGGGYWQTTESTDAGEEEASFEG